MVIKLALYRDKVTIVFKSNTVENYIVAVQQCVRTKDITGSSNEAQDVFVFMCCIIMAENKTLKSLKNTSAKSVL